MDTQKNVPGSNSLLEPQYPLGKPHPNMSTLTSAASWPAEIGLIRGARPRDGRWVSESWTLLLRKPLPEADQSWYINCQNYLWYCDSIPPSSLQNCNWLVFSQTWGQEVYSLELGIGDIILSFTLNPCHFLNQSFPPLSNGVNNNCLHFGSMLWVL